MKLRILVTDGDGADPEATNEAVAVLKVAARWLRTRL
jgi:isocitrate/isopropylmalate dehydrogenase